MVDADSGSSSINILGKREGKRNFYRKILQKKNKRSMQKIAILKLEMQIWPIFIIFEIILGSKTGQEKMPCSPHATTGSRGGRKRLPKFKFSAKFPIGLHVTLQIQIKNSKMTAILCEKLF